MPYGAPHWLSAGRDDEQRTDIESWIHERLDDDDRPIPTHAAIAHNAHRAYRIPEAVTAPDTFTW